MVILSCPFTAPVTQPIELHGVSIDLKIVLLIKTGFNLLKVFKIVFYCDRLLDHQSIKGPN